MRPVRDLAGQKLGRWEVLKRAPNHGKYTMWRCRCECGTERDVKSPHLVSGASRSCGCITRTHGGSIGSPEYKSWAHMRRRCAAKAGREAKNYSQRGIRVCERWNDFQNFLADMGKKPTPQHSIERIDNDKGYGPDNCRWATAREQASNRRNNVWMSLNGERLTMSECSRRTGIPRGVLRIRRLRGWTDQLAITTPVGANP